MRYIRNIRCIGTSLLFALSACQGSDGSDDDREENHDKHRDSDDDPDDDRNDTDGPDPSDDPNDNNNEVEDEEPPGADPKKPFSPPEPVLRALLASQYSASIRDLLGDAAAQAASPPEDPSPISGFAIIGASRLSIDSTAVEQYESSARAVAARAIQNRDRINKIAKCDPETSDDCIERFIEQFGRLTFRRPMEKDEQDRYLKAAGEGSYLERVESVIATMLQSPFFLYQVERGFKVKGTDERRRLTGYELATRMSYFLLGTTPSPELLEAAQAGELDTAQGVRQVAAEMIEDADARASLNSFWYEMLHLDHIDAGSKDQDLFAIWDEDMANSVKQETLTFLDQVIWEDHANFQELWTADYTYVNRDVATLYGMSTRGLDNSFERRDLPEDSKRGGLLGHASFLTGVSHSTTTSPTLRGKQVMEKFLCVTIPAPPPEANDEFNPTEGGAKTKAELLKQHLEDPSCASCHDLMDPIGLGLENFNAIGQFRTEENGVELETRHDAATLGEFDGAAELGVLIAEDDRSPACFARNLFRFATGHIETDGEEGSIDAMVDAFEGADYDIPTLLVEIVSSQAFRYVGDINE